MVYRRPIIAARFSRTARKLAVGLLLLALTACASLGASGPETRAVRNADEKSVGSANIQIIPVTDDVARRVLAASRFGSFSEVLGDVAPEWTLIGSGDVLQVSIWEAPPAVLFGATSTFGTSSAGLNTMAGPLAQQNSMPEMMVDADGMIQPGVDSGSSEVDVLVVEGIELRQAAGVGAEGVGQVLAGLVEAAAAVLGRPMGVVEARHGADAAQGGAVVDGILDGEDRLGPIVEAPEEVFGEVGLQVILARAYH